MNQRWILPAILVLIVGGIAALAIWGPDRDWDRHREVEVVRVVDDGDATTDAGDTIVVERDRGFFPFGLLFFPLVVLAVFLLLRAVIWGGRPPGPWHHGGPPSSAWLDDWHRRQHEPEGKATGGDRPAA